MIAFAPLEDFPPPPVPAASKPQQNPSQTLPQLPTKEFFGNSSTECNYLLMFFIFGVVALAIRDMTIAN